MAQEVSAFPGTHGARAAAWLSDARGARRVPAMCCAVLPLLSSGLDVLGAAGQAGAGQDRAGATHGL